jgi:predicted  nucleic acid-binding Zn-ribbon protein
MTTLVKEQLIALVALQKAENQIAVIEKYLVGVEDQIKELGSQVDQIQNEVVQGQQMLDSLKKKYRDDEVEVRSLESQQVKSQEKLRSVKTNKEYQSMLKEIDDLKMKASEIEDRMLDELEQIEKAEKQVVEKKKDLAVFQKDIEEQQLKIRQSAQEQIQQLEEYKKQRDEVHAQLSPQLQKIFQRLKQQCRGIAIAAVDSAVCQVCHLNIPPQMYNELLRLDSLRNCPNCQRIIYPPTLFDR